ncbi:DNA polymerase I, partial [bacterium]|nr:DNA polymerase I [bacterium]
MSERPTLYLLDGHAITYRQYYVVTRTPQLNQLTSRSGEPTGTIHRFTSVLLDILEKDRPEYLVATFDDGLSGRETYYPAYKAQRADPPADFEPQLKRVHELVEAFNIPLFTLQGFEADDVIGTLSRQAEEQGINIHIITGDKDILQLLSPYVTVRIPRFGEADIVWDEAHFQQEYGFPPLRLIDYKALVGDTSDNIPGVAGIGDKTAKQLLQQYGSLDGIYQNLQLLSKGVREKLTIGRDNAYMSYRLASIMRDLPITLDLERCLTHDFDVPTVEALFDEFSFRSHTDRLYRILNTDAQTPRHDASTKTDAIDIVHTIIVDDDEKLSGLVQVLESASHIAFDTETTSVDQMRAELVGISLSVDGSTAYYIPVGHVSEGAGTMFATPVPNQLPLEQVIAALRGPLTDPNIPKYAHNASYDLVVLRRAGIDVQPITFDTMIAEWIVDPISKDLGLKNLAFKRLGVRMQEIDTLLKAKKRKTMAEVPIDEAAPYAAADAAMTLQLALETLTIPLATPQSLRQEMQDKALVSLFKTLEMPLIPVIADMEQNGVLLDVPYLAQLSEKLRGMMESLEQRIYGIVGAPFNIGSPKQLNEVLFEKLKLSVAGLRKTAQGYSTDVNTLDALYDKHPVVPIILEYRELAKLKSTYIDALPSLVNPRTGRVHTSYNQTGTSTGRFSSNSPNLQNIPNKTEVGRDVRRAFIAPTGHVLLSVDYSQIELRLMAHI